MRAARLNTHQKASRINLAAAKYGTFAEIGAGQEVARWFFHVGGAAGTVAKTISAYDMAISDAIYGRTDRYVSRQRLAAMLDHEYGLLQERVPNRQGDATTFFVFADTVTTRSHTRHEDGHGWLGVRFQHEPGSSPSDIIIHIRILDLEPAREQEALGILGVNLIYGAFYHYHQPAALIRSLLDDLTHERIEVDMIKFSGPSFRNVDNRLMSLQLVQQGFTDAAMFAPDGEVVQPAEILHRKPVLIERGSFRPITNSTLDMVQRVHARLLDERHVRQPGQTGQEPVVVMEMSLENLLSGKHLDHMDFLARVDILAALDKTVMVSTYAHYWRLAAYLRRYTPEPIGFIMGVPHLKELFREKYYTELDGGVLESMGRLFKRGVTLYVYPSKDTESAGVITAERMEVPESLRHVYAHLLENRLIEPIADVSEKELHLFPRDALAKIQRGDPSWETMVPPAAVTIIKARRIFGYRPSPRRQLQPA
jgi:hypothetical protein